MGRILNKLATALLTEKALLAIVDVTVFDRVLGLAGWAIRHGGDRALRSHPNKIIITTGVLPNLSGFFNAPCEVFKQESNYPPARVAFASRPPKKQGRTPAF